MSLSTAIWRQQVSVSSAVTLISGGVTHCQVVLHTVKPQLYTLDPLLTFCATSIKPFQVCAHQIIHFDELFYSFYCKSTGVLETDTLENRNMGVTPAVTTCVISFSTSLAKLSPGALHFKMQYCVALMSNQMWWRLFRLNCVVVFSEMSVIS